jgi:hypothetical protein
MKFFRNQYISGFTTAVLLCGWLTLLLPAKYNLESVDAFTNWLNLHISDRNGDDAGEKIREIRLYKSDIIGFVHNAANVISRNTDLFNLPFDSSEDPDVMVSRLLAAFNQSNGSGMQNNAVLSVLTHKHYLTTKSIQMSWHHSLSPDRIAGLSYFEIPVRAGIGFITGCMLSPLVSGISIGAP